MERINKRKSYRFWEPAWWRDDPERIRWAATIGVIALLLAGGMYVDNRRNQAAQPEQAGPLVTSEDVVSSLAAGEKGNSQSPSMSLQAGGQPIGDAANDKPAQEAPAQSAGAAVEEPEQTLPVLAGALNFSLPVAESDGGKVIRGYGYSWDPTTEDYRFHQGLDFALAAGSPIYAVAAGTVTQAEEDIYWGGVVAIEHFEGCRTIYRGIAPQVAAGDEISAGSLIGHHIACPAELAEESHVHVEAEINGERIDPAQYL